MKIASRQVFGTIPRYTMLFNLEQDPRQENPIDSVAEEARLSARMAELMQANGAPAEQFERLGLAVPETA